MEDWSEDGLRVADNPPESSDLLPLLLELDRRAISRRDGIAVH